MLHVTIINDIFSSFFFCFYYSFEVNKRFTVFKKLILFLEIYTLFCVCTIQVNGNGGVRHPRLVQWHGRIVEKKIDEKHAANFSLHIFINLF